MDQDLYDIDPEYRKKYDADMKKYAKAMKNSPEGSIQDFLDKRSPESKAAAEQRMKDYTEGRAKSMEEFKANMQKTSEAHDAKMKELRSTTKSGGSGAAGSGLDIEGKTGRNVKPKLRAGGMVSSASKRADGCAIKGKTKGRMV